MRKILIKKEVGPLGDDNDIRVIWDEKEIGVIKIGEMEFSFPISATQRTIQTEIIDDRGRSHRSNAYFVLNGKCPTLYLKVSGMSMKLETK